MRAHGRRAAALLGVLALWLVCGADAARAQALAQPPGLQRAIISVPIGKGGTLEALLTKPAAPGRYPLMVLSHGAPRDVAELPTTVPTAHSAVAIEFARRGWAVVAPMRRGYGKSSGPFAEGSGSCNNENYERSGKASSDDVIATVKAMASRDDIDPQRVLLVGVSAGGFASIAAAAQHPPGVVAVIAFAPGRGSTGPDTVCQEDKLIQAYGVYGRTIRIPTIWFSAKNDHYFQPALAHRFFAAFTGAGGTGEFVDLPAFGKDGHFLLDSDGVPLWRDRVDAFLRAHQLPTWAKPVAESMPSVRPPRQLGTNGRKGFDSYLADANFEKAFAVNRDGGYGWDSGYRSGDEAAQAALASCRKHGPGCEIYAINNALAR